MSNPQELFHIFSFILFSIVSQLTWRQLISLYPHLVELTALDASHIGRALRSALRQYADLLQPPGLSACNGF